MTVGHPFMLPPGTTLQHARLYHALREAGLRPFLRPEERAAFAQLGAATGIALESGVAPVLPGLSIDHHAPRTQVGNLKRALIFPHALVQLCRNSWAEQRALKASFRGLFTPERRRVLEPWEYYGIEGIQVADVSRGRDPSVKYWDVSYFEELGNSQFALCPDGDLPYSYRTFEAALCGAIPIVETQQAIYGELHVYTLDGVSPEQLPEWRKETAEINLRLCRRLVTLPTDELTAEVLRLRGAR